MGYLTKWSTDVYDACPLKTEDILTTLGKLLHESDLPFRSH